MEENKELVVIAVVLLLFLGAIGIYGWEAGEQYKDCIQKCLKQLNLTFVKSDYFADACYCVYIWNDTKIKV